MLPDLESLRVFEAAARHLNFRAAAREIGLSPPAFTTRLKRLEEQLDVELFSRTTRQVGLTEAGARLVPVAVRTLESARECETAVRGGIRPPYSLIIGTRFELGLSWLTPALDVLERAAPERTLHIHFGNSPELLAQTRRGEVDATVTSARLGGDPLSYALLHEETYAFVSTAPDDDGARLKSARQAEDFVLLDAGVDMPLFRYFLDARPPKEVWGFKRVEILGAIAAIRHRLLNGDEHRERVAVLPRYLIQDDLVDGRLTELFPRTHIESDYFRLVWRAGHALEAELFDLAAQLRELELR